MCNDSSIGVLQQRSLIIRRRLSSNYVIHTQLFFFCFPPYNSIKPNWQYYCSNNTAIYKTRNVNIKTACCSKYLCSFESSNSNFIEWKHNKIEREWIPYVPKCSASPRNITLIEVAMTIDRGLKSDIYTGPLRRRPQVWTRQLRPVLKNPCI